MASSLAVLLLQLGTPDAPTTPALRRYLRQFLGDPRVIEAPRLLWWFILHFRILPTRPAQSAEKYRRIWDAQTGSPLLHITRLQTEALQRALPQVPVRFAMQIGNPPVAKVLRELIAAGVDRLLVLPMYPQYSATTTASAMDVLFGALMKERRVPALRVVPPYYDHPAYLDAVAAVVREHLAKLPDAAGAFCLELSRHPDQVRPARRSVCHARQAQHGRAGEAARLAARTLDAVVSIAVRQGPLAAALYGRNPGAAGETRHSPRVHRHARIHDRLPGNHRRDRFRGPRNLPSCRRRGIVPLSLPERSSRSGSRRCGRWCSRKGKDGCSERSA